MLAKPLENMTRLLKYAKIAHGTRNTGGRNQNQNQKKRNHQAQLLNNNAEQYNVFAALSCMPIE